MANPYENFLGVSNSFGLCAVQTPYNKGVHPCPSDCVLAANDLLPIFTS